MKKFVSIMVCLCVISGMLFVPALSYDIPYDGYVGKWQASDGSNEPVEGWAITATAYMTDEPYANNYIVFSGYGNMVDWDPDVYDYMGLHNPWCGYFWDTKDFVAVIEDGITSIGAYTFYCMEYLNEVSIPSSVTKIGDGAFKATALNSVELPENLKYIGKESFNDYGLTEVDIPASVDYIGVSAFSYYNLDSFTLDPKNTAYKLENNMLFTADGETLVAYTVKDIPSDLAIPEGVKAIGAEAFSGYNSLESVTIPETVESIGDYAFNYYRNPLTVTVLNKDIVFGKSAIYGKDVTIYGYYGSTAQAYAEEKGLDFVGFKCFDDEAFSAELENIEVTYNEAEQKPVITVSYDDEILTENTDYIVEYFRNGKLTTDFTSVGEIDVKITGVEDSFCFGEKILVYSIVDLEPEHDDTQSDSGKDDTEDTDNTKINITITVSPWIMFIIRWVLRILFSVFI